jgi:hypothetical protein
MITIERQVGPFCYRKVWFASREEAMEISQPLRPNEVLRFFGASEDLGALPHLVRHRKLRTAWIDLSGGPEQILEGMKRKSCRYEIRRAEKMLDRVRIETGSEKANHDFLLLYNNFAKAKKLPKLPVRWLREYTAHGGEAFVLYLEGEPLCGHLLLRDTTRRLVRLLYSGSHRLDSPEDAAACGALNRYLHWYEMQRYCAAEFMTYDFGGIRDPEEPISRFKLSFGGVIVAEHYYLFSGTPWVARLGNLVYEKFLRRGSGNEKQGK